MVPTHLLNFTHRGSQHESQPAEPNLRGAVVSTPHGIDNTQQMTTTFKRNRLNRIEVKIARHYHTKANIDEIIRHRRGDLGNKPRPDTELILRPRPIDSDKCVNATSLEQTHRKSTRTETLCTETLSRTQRSCSQLRVAP